jgi:TM2 domain-containing membrane protein YozV
MSAEGSLDLRLPIGGLFSVLGVMLACFGLVTGGDAEMYAKSAGMNINLIWGVVMMITGVIFLVLAKRGAAKS